MRLTLDGFVLRFPRTGIVNYVFNVLTLLGERPDVDVTVLLQDFGFHDAAIAAFVKERATAQLVVPHAATGRLARSWERLRARKLAAHLADPIEIARAVEPGSVYHATDWYHYPSPYARLNVITAFDLTAKLFPDFHEHTNIVKETRKAAAFHEFDRIVAISHATKSDLVERLGVSSEKIEVSHLGVDRIYDDPPPRDRAEILSKYKIGTEGRYVLSVSTIEPRKNIIGILKAFKALRDSSPDFADVSLVLSGHMGWRNDSLNQFLAAFPYRGSVVFTGYVDLDDMPGLYAHAEAFLYLSFYEGFGIPILEAMKCSCPVICSDTSSMPEILGDCGVLVSPHDPDAAAAALARILTDGLHADSLRFAGFARSGEFSWARHVEDLVRIYDGG